MSSLGRSLAALLVLTCTAGCSPATIGIRRMADKLTQTASSFSQDSDPEFVRTAAPATLKMIEMLLDDQPSHAGLLMTACRGFTQYAYAFMQVDAEIVHGRDAAMADDLNRRAGLMYDRARRYCLRGVELRNPGFEAALSNDPKAALSRATREDVPGLYWAAVAWGGSIGVGANPLARIPEFSTVRAMLTRALELDEAWEGGAIHEAMIALEGLPALLGGSAARARKHFDRAVELSSGESAFAYVTMATSVAEPAKDRAEFEKLLKAALAIDVNTRPGLRLANLIAQKRAKFLLSRPPGEPRG